MTEKDMREASDSPRFPANPGRTLCMMREPLFTGLDIAAFVVSLVMVCMPLALGVFSR